MHDSRLKSLALGLACALLVLAIPCWCLADDAAAKPAANTVVPTNGMQITADTTLTPGTYVLDKGLEIAADGVTLDGNGAVLIGTDFKNTAVSATGKKNFTIKNVVAQRYMYGIKLQDCQNITLDKNNMPKNAELPPLNYWTDLNASAEDTNYGSGILLIKVTGGKVTNNYLEHQLNGIRMYSCTGLTVEKNDCCYASGWGIQMNDSSNNIIQDNLADFCDRVHFRGGDKDYVGADAAGLLMTNNSCKNQILRNYFRSGGDGIFMTGGKNGCNDNLVEGNDCSLSPNNAIEAWGTQRNIFRKNKCNKSNYGFWLGGASNCQIVENQVAWNRFSGITCDHGNSNTVSKNIVVGNRQGIMLWSNNPRPADSAPAPYGDTYGWVITDNDCRQNREAIYILSATPGDVRCYDLTITGNKIGDSRIGIVLERVKNSKVDANIMTGNAIEDIRQVECTGITVTGTVVNPPSGNAENDALPFEVPREKKPAAK